MRRLQPSDRRRLGVRDRGNDLQRAGTLECLVSGEHLVQHAAERENVHAMIARPSVELLGRHVLDGATEAARAVHARRPRRHHRRTHRLAQGQLGRLRADRRGPRRQSEVEQLDVDGTRRAGASGKGGPTATNQHDVTGLQIAVDDAGAVRTIERTGDLRRNRQCFIDREPRGSQQAIGEGFAFEILEHQVVEIAVAANVVDGTDVGIVQRGNRARLLLETASRLRIGGECAGEHFDGNRPIEPSVTRAVDLAHATRTNRGDDFIRAKTCAGLERHAKRNCSRRTGPRIG